MTWFRHTEVWKMEKLSLKKYVNERHNINSAENEKLVKEKNRTNVR